MQAPPAALSLARSASASFRLFSETRMMNVEGARRRTFSDQRQFTGAGFVT